MDPAQQVVAGHVADQIGVDAACGPGSSSEPTRATYPHSQSMMFATGELQRGSDGHDMLALADESGGALESAQVARNVRPVIRLRVRVESRRQLMQGAG
jgi:hypothetical protein